MCSLLSPGAEDTTGLRHGWTQKSLPCEYWLLPCRGPHCLFIPRLLVLRLRLLRWMNFRHRVLGVVPALTSEIRTEDCSHSPSSDIGQMMIGDLEGVGTGVKAFYMTLQVQLAKDLACCLFSVPCHLSEWFTETWAPSLSNCQEGSLWSPVHWLFTNMKNSRLPTAKKTHQGLASGNLQVSGTGKMSQISCFNCKDVLNSKDILDHGWGFSSDSSGLFSKFGFLRTWGEWLVIVL